MSSNIRVERVCSHCGNSFIAKTIVTNYCSHKCSQHAYKQRQREEKLKRINQKELSKPISNQSPTLNNKDFLSVEETAQLLNVGKSTVHRYCWDGKINCVRLNRKIFIRRSDIELLFDNTEGYVKRAMEQMQPITEFYSTKEIMEKYNVCKSTIQKITTGKNIPKTGYRGRTIYSKSHIDKHFALYNPHSDIQDWYTVEEIMIKYSMTKTAVYSAVSTSGVPRKNHKGHTLYSMSHIDGLLSKKLDYDTSITEWYNTDDIVEKYGLTKGYIANVIYKNPVPKKSVGNQSYYSKKHFDEMIIRKRPELEYYYMEEAMEKFQITRDALYYQVKANNIPKIKEGKRVKISKSALDKLFEKPKIQRYGYY
jgi:hypothetical protein